MKLFPGLVAEWAEVNLNSLARRDFNPTFNPLVDPKSCDVWVRFHTMLTKKDYSYGGYLEDREYLWREHYLPAGPQIHLGVDYNVPSGTAVACILPGTVVYTGFDFSFGGWGGLVVVKNEDKYTYYAHLGALCVQVGDHVEGGKIIGCVGIPEVNGGWYPHLHLQMVSLEKMQEFKSYTDVDGYAPPSALPPLALLLDSRFPNPYPDPTPYVTL